MSCSCKNTSCSCTDSTGGEHVQPIVYLGMDLNPNQGMFLSRQRDLSMGFFGRNRDSRMQSKIDLAIRGKKYLY